MRVAVTGAAGFIGSHAVLRLVALGHEVTGIDSFDSYYDPAIKRANAGRLTEVGVTVHEQDIAGDGIERCLDGADAILHLAARAGVRASWGRAFQDHVRSNVLGTQRLLEWAAQSRPAFVFVSSSSVYGNAAEGPRREDHVLDPRSPYGVTKVAGEQLTFLYGKGHDFPATVIRPFSIYGPRERPDKAIQRFLIAARDGTPIKVHGDGSQRRDFTYVGDLVEALVRALDAVPAGEIINVSRGETFALSTVIETITEVTGRPLDIEYGPRLAGDVDVTWGDTQKAKRLLGYEPTTDLRAGIEQQWAAVQG